MTALGFKPIFRSQRHKRQKIGMLADKRVFILESEFLVALDMQRILEGAHVATTLFARTIEEAQAFTERFGEFDLAILDMPESTLSALALARQFLGAGAALVITSPDGPDTRLLLQGPPIVRKPFSDVDLLTACILALATSSR